LYYGRVLTDEQLQDLRQSLDSVLTGKSAAAAEMISNMGTGGQVVTQVYEGEKRFDLTVRWLAPYRSSIEAIREITVATPTGSTVPLGQIATITLQDGPSVIYRENGERYAPVKFSVRGRDLASTIAESQAQIAKNVHLPYNSHLEWAGEINQLKEAIDRLKLILPITLLLIVFLVYSAVKTPVDTFIVIMNIPVASAGGELAELRPLVPRLIDDFRSGEVANDVQSLKRCFGDRLAAAEARRIQSEQGRDRLCQGGVKRSGALARRDRRGDGAEARD